VRGNGREAITHAENALKCFEDTQFLSLLGMGHLSLGWGHLLLGEPDAAREHVEKGRETDKAVGVSLFVSWYYQLMGLINLEMGNWGNVRRYAEEGLEQGHGVKFWDALLYILLGTALAKSQSSQTGRAERYVLKGIKSFKDLRLRPMEAQGYSYLADLYADAGQTEKALTTLKKAEGMFREMGMDYWLAKTEKALEKLRG
jgi:tetratricopeptide (TPR) repeat protein